MSQRPLIFTALAVVLGLTAGSSLFVLDVTEQAVVKQFGNPVRVLRTPGLQAKIPFFQDVVFFDKRVLDLAPPGQQVTLADQKRLEVDAFARYRINDPLMFLQTLQNEARATDQLNTIVNSSLRRVMGNVTMADVLSGKRADIMASIRDQVNKEGKALGVEIVDVRIRRADLPEQTSQAIFDRMRSERQREAAEFRAQGQQQAQEIRASADRERTILLAEAQRTADTLRGEGDRDALTTIGNAAAKDKDFYAFYRSLSAYKTSLKGEDTSFVLSPTSPFFKYFGGQR
jgi:modulator of FtsH protease HflC